MEHFFCYSIYNQEVFCKLKNNFTCKQYSCNNIYLRFTICRINTDFYMKQWYITSTVWVHIPILHNINNNNLSNIPTKPLHNHVIVSVYFVHFYCMEISDKVSRDLALLKLPSLFINLSQIKYSNDYIIFILWRFVTKYAET